MVSVGVHDYSENQTYSYQKDIKPILEQKCIACHGCYDAPCQLKLTSSEGLARGATKKTVYDGERLFAIKPTRLFVDAKTSSEWRKKEFFPVLNEGGAGSQDNLDYSLLYKMITLGKDHPVKQGSIIPEYIKLGLKRENECPQLSGFDDYARDKPQQGMPLAITGLSDIEYKTFKTWIEEGALLDDLHAPLLKAEEDSILQWEDFFNQTSKRNLLVSRYIYEHLYLAHLYLEDLNSDSFFQLVRSSTPSGEPVNIISTVRPNNDPGKDFYYRIKKIQSTIVHKTHITYPLSSKKLEHLQNLFFTGNWELKDLPDYSSRSAANPHLTFASIPVRSRYQFLLDNAKYFVRTFIRGPVCRGQIATNVLNDHFYVLFMDPDHDLSVIKPDYEKAISSLLTLPDEKHGRLPAGTDYLEIQEKWKEYIRVRGENYSKHQPSGASLDDIWDGDGINKDAALSIFRHFDNSSVVEGFVGEVPETIWFMDYPLLENTYYSLVVNFDVFGSVFLQAATRMHFDLIRSNAENNFLQFMPVDKRDSMRKYWYRGKFAQVKSYLAYEIGNQDRPAGIHFNTKDPGSEFVSLVLKKLSSLDYSEDELNRCAKPPCFNKDGSSLQRVVESSLETLTSKTASLSSMKFIDYMPEVVFLRISTDYPEKDLAYTLLRNKAHTNVAFMFKEEDRREPAEDTLTAYRGLLGSYPNFFFNVPGKEVKVFVELLHKVHDEKGFIEIIERYGISRTHPEIWEHFHWFVQYMKQFKPKEAGIYDLNRYLKVKDLLSAIEQ